MLPSSTPVFHDRSVNGSIKSEQNRVLNQRPGITAFSLRDCFFATSYSPRNRAENNANPNHINTLCYLEIVTETYANHLLELDFCSVCNGFTICIGFKSLDVIIILEG